jgi:hypothetical protein
MLSESSQYQSLTYDAVSSAENSESEDDRADRHLSPHFSPSTPPVGPLVNISKGSVSALPPLQPLSLVSMTLAPAITKVELPVQDQQLAEEIEWAQLFRRMEELTALKTTAIDELEQLLVVRDTIQDCMKSVVKNWNPHQSDQEQRLITMRKKLDESWYDPPSTPQKQQQLTNTTLS